jgi:hypothetical protein
VLFGRTIDLSRFDGVGAEQVVRTASDGADFDRLFDVDLPTFFPVANAHPTPDGQLTAENLPDPLSIGLFGPGLTGIAAPHRRKRVAANV